MIFCVYFSPTGTTKKLTEYIAQKLSEKTGEECRRIDYCSAAVRREGMSFKKTDTVIFGMPTYAGRVPNLIMKQMDGVLGNGARCVPVVTFGNRAFDDALIELRDILHRNGFLPIAAGAFAAAHSFSETLGAGRPDEQDMALAAELAERAFERSGSAECIAVDGTPAPYRGYYQPRLADGTPIDIRKVKPKTGDACIGCGLCAEICPMEAIRKDDPKAVTGICIKCGACIKRCPAKAKYIDDPGYIAHKLDLEMNQAEPKQSRIY